MVSPRATSPREYLPRMTLLRVLIINDITPHWTLPRIVLSPVQSDTSPRVTLPRIVIKIDTYYYYYVPMMAR